MSFFKLSNKIYRKSFLWIVCIVVVVKVAATDSSDDIETLLGNVGDITELDEDPEELRRKIQSTEVTIQSLLQHFSTEATNARADIHRNLEDAVRYIEELSKKRCGSAVERYRSKIVELEEQLNTLNQSFQNCLSKQDKLQIVVQSVTGEREKALAEINSLKELLSKEKRLRNETERKLQWNLAIVNATDTFSSIENVLFHTNAQLNKRNEVLQHLVSSIAQADSQSEELVTIFQHLEEMIQQESSQYRQALFHLLQLGDTETVNSSELSQKALKDLERQLSSCVQKLSQKSFVVENRKQEFNETSQSPSFQPATWERSYSVSVTTILISFMASFLGTFLSYWLFLRTNRLNEKMGRDRQSRITSIAHDPQTPSPNGFSRNTRAFHHSENSPMQPVVSSISPR
ncbi:hypothetical protein Gasu2_27930 [Galdieria sulphuraria]|uniref:Uncharacterized protein n=1 Tax=Galdieria sulphuraria TaxID=130081 RepID=M2WX02_GALSU|nr:uncharacterized protein Gasu_39190 [Galdieria sulphuraria]EME28540.1 hypothetical protein Gasu_39190 [Galdieria sulphuraria]GJD08496.1 hypothetical protein Gasu2_27930 [Galdieria sulphuraria]|eukprot:XP_005705060.1 hypothetical protein Gasu_39190 [Galdieria sulphuraria]